jgi:hypothetical protein
MGFFDEQDNKSEPIRHPIPDWFQPPARMIGKPLANTVLVKQTADCAVALTQFVAYPDGLRWDVLVRFADQFPAERHRMAWEGADRAMFGIRCADGTAVYPSQSEEWPPVSRPQGILLRQCGGTGDDSGISFGLWLNPLPSEPFHLIFA